MRILSIVGFGSALLAGTSVLLAQQQRGTPLESVPVAASIVAGPEISTTLSELGPIAVGVEVEFDVIATDPEGELVSLSLLNPPMGMVFQPVIGARRTAKTHVRWVVGGNEGPELHLVFEARAESGRKTRLVQQVSLQEGRLNRASIMTGDVTGDGLLDVVGRDRTGQVFVWSGTTSPTPTPHATLLRAKDFQLGEVTGDGVLDVILKRDASVIVHAGGDTLVGSPAPVARLLVPTVHPGIANLKRIHVADVSGDGQGDVVAAVPGFDVPGDFNSGAVFVWRGGADLVGVPQEMARLRLPEFNTGSTLQIADVTGDGVPDLVSSSAAADVGDIGNAGAVAVWKGGATLAGEAAPTALLQSPDPIEGDQLRLYRLADVTNDGLLDVVAGSHLIGAEDRGAVLIWAGGTGLLGVPAPLATLRVPDAVVGDQLGFSAINFPPSLFIGELTGDGQDDLIVGARLADVDGVADAGALYVWAGGTSLSGDTEPVATLRSADPGEELISTANNGTVLIDDLDADGQPDIALASSREDNAFRGAILVWRGGVGLTGVPEANVVLRDPDATPLASLGRSGLRAVDLDGDGRRDLMASANGQNLPRAYAVGALHVWSGGSEFFSRSEPTSTLISREAGALGFLGTYLLQGVRLGDVTGDGAIDIIAESEGRFGRGSYGKILVWEAGRPLSRYPQVRARLEVPGDLRNAELGLNGTLLADVNGDGLLDIVNSARRAGRASRPESGEVYVWAGGDRLTGRAPATILIALDAQPYDELTNLDGVPIRSADVTGDGQLDLISGSSFADVDGAEDAGSFSVWKGEGMPPGLEVIATQRLSAPGSVHLGG